MRVALLAALLAPTIATAEPWTVERVLGTVRRTDPGLRAVAAAGTAGRAQAAQGWATLSPQVTASAGFTRTDDPAILFSQRLWQGQFTSSDFAIDRLNQPAAASAFQVGLTVDQSLFDGGRELATPALATGRARAAGDMERAAAGDRLLAGVETWAAAVRAREAVRAAAQALGAAQAMRDAAGERYRRGLVPELDTLRAAARESDARVRLSGARQGLGVAVAALSRLVRTAVDAESLAVSDEADSLAAANDPPDGSDPPAASVGTADGRGELAAAREGEAVARLEARTAGLRLLPAVRSRLALTQYRPAGGGAFEPRWMVAVTADLPLFDGAQRLNEWRAARARAAEARAGAERLAIDLATALDAARVEGQVARERRDAARQGRAAAEEALRFATMRYRAGLLPLGDLLATDAEATAARAAEIESSTAVTLARYRLLHAQGDLR